MMTISNTSDPLMATFFSLMGGKFLLRETEGGDYWNVLDDDGNVIGSASSYPYGERGFAVHTRPFAGFVPREQVIFV